MTTLSPPSSTDPLECELIEGENEEEIQNCSSCSSTASSPSSFEDPTNHEADEDGFISKTNVNKNFKLTFKDSLVIHHRHVHHHHHHHHHHHQFPLKKEEEEEEEEEKSFLVKKSTFSSLPESIIRQNFTKLKSYHDNESDVIKSIPSHHLGYYLNTNPESLIIIDCRSFMKFNRKHIKGSMNACCTNNTIKKRFSDGKIGVIDLISGVNNKEKFIKLSSRDVLVIIYDDDTISLDTMKSTVSCLKIMAEKLKKKNLNIKFLAGGIEEFEKSHNHLCSEESNLNPPPLLSPTSPSTDSAIDTTLMTKVFDYLYLGNEKDARDIETLKRENFTHVLNVSAKIPLFCEEGTNIQSKRLPASDSGSQNLKQYFNEAIDFIELARNKEGGKVLVHCQAGVSRSPSIVMAYLMVKLKLGMFKVFNILKKMRPIISPNINFMGQLLEFEGKIDFFQLEDSHLEKELFEMENGKNYGENELEESEEGENKKDEEDKEIEDEKNGE